MAIIIHILNDRWHIFIKIFEKILHSDIEQYAFKMQDWFNNETQFEISLLSLSSFYKLYHKKSENLEFELLCKLLVSLCSFNMNKIEYRTFHICWALCKYWSWQTNNLIRSDRIGQYAELCTVQNHSIWSCESFAFDALKGIRTNKSLSSEVSNSSSLSFY